MASFRTIIILGGLMVLGLLWGSFLASDDEFQGAARDIQFYRWALAVGLSFIIVIRVWDAWYQHSERDKRDVRGPNDPRDTRDARRLDDPRDTIDPIRPSDRARRAP